MKLSYIFKISDAHDNILAQITDPNNINISETLNDFYSAEFFLPFTSPFATKDIIKPLNRVDVYEQIGDTETKVFEGVIRGYEPDLSGVTVKIEDFLYLFSRRILADAGVSVSAVPLNTALQDILDDLNTEDDMGITLDTDITTAISKTYLRGTDFADILRDLSVTVTAEFRIRNRVLEFKSTIGTDRTISGTAEYTSFRFDINNPNETNIKDASAPVDANDFANAVLGKQGANYSLKINSASIAEYGRIETAEGFEDSDGSIDTQTQKALDIASAVPQYPKVAPNMDGLYYQNVNIGDTVSVYINTGNELFTFDGSYKVVRKTLVRSDFSLPIIDLEFSENATSDKDMVGSLNDLSSRVKKLELRI